MKHAVRSADAADEADVIALWRAANLVVDDNDPSADFQFAKRGPASDILVAEDGHGTIVGCVMVGHDGHRGWLYYLAVAPDRRRLGIGRGLVQAAERWLQACRVAKVQLMVRDSNVAVVPFYEALGFEVTPRVVMARWLNAGGDPTPSPDPSGR